MQMTLYSAELSSLSQRLQSCLADSPVNVQCAVREGHLIVLGQHSDDVTLDASEIFYSLEHNIQALHLKFTQQVRLYLRIMGERYPYAHSWFTIQPSLSPSQASAPQVKQAIAPSQLRLSLADQAIAPTQQRVSQAKSKPLVESRAWVDDDETDDTFVDRLSSFETTTVEVDPLGGRLNDQASASSAETPAAVQVLTLQNSRSLGDRLLENWQTWSESLQRRRSPQSEPSQGIASHIPTESQLASSYIHRRERWSDRLDTRLSIALGITTLGTLGGFYVSSQSCVVGECPELETAQALNQEISDDMQNVASWDDLDSIQQSIQRGISLLEPIPLWSRHSQESQPLLDIYQSQASLVEQLIAVEQLTTAADSSQQTPIYTTDEWVSVRSLWQSTITQLSAIPPDSDLFEFAQQRLTIHQQQLAQVERQIQSEEEAASVLNLAQSTAQLAQARQQAAQSPQDWQNVQTLWTNALEQLRQVPENSIAALDAKRQLDFYKTSLDSVNQRLGTAIPILESTPISAEVMPTAAEVAVGSPSNQEVETALNQICIGGSRFCRVLSTNEVIRVQLDLDYADAISEAQTSNNRRLGAIATHHQKLLREALKTTSSRFGLPLELYNSDETLLEEFRPDSRSATLPN